MKKRNWLLLLAIAVCLALYVGYRAMDRLKTDTTPPQITFSDEAAEFSVHDPMDVLLRGVTAADTRDGDVTASLVVEQVRLLDPDGFLRIRYAAFDRSGNVTKADRTARYTDYESPRFSLEEPLLFTLNSGFDILKVIGASDALDGDIRHRIRATSLDNASVATLGSHQVEFRVTNSLGETVLLTLPVEVYAAGPYLIYLDAGTPFDPDRYLDSVTRNREKISLRNRTPEGFSVKVSGDVDTGIPGVYVVDYTITHSLVNQYNPGNSQISTGFSRLIVVVEG